MTRGQITYNAFTKALKAEKGVTHREAQAVYRSMTERLGRQATRADIKSHPRITTQEINKSIFKESVHGGSKRQGGGGGSRGGAGGGGGGAIGGVHGGSSDYDDPFFDYDDDSWYDFEDPINDTGGES